MAILAEQIVLRNGAPAHLLTNQGATFTPKLLRDVYDMLQIRKSPTTAYHPECNRAVESLNKNNIKTHSHYGESDKREWDLWLPYCTFAYNMATHESAGKPLSFYCKDERPTCRKCFTISPE